MKANKDKIVHWFIIGIFTSLYFFVATMSMINSISFFDLAHGKAMSWALAIAFEMGTAASLASIIILEKMNRVIVWLLFWTLTIFQCMANSYDSFVNLENYYGWVELFGLTEEEPIFQKRVLSILSGAILPLVALGFIKSLADYIKPSGKQQVIKEDNKEEELVEDKEPIPAPANLIVEEQKIKTVEDKMYDSMSKDDKQKILSYLKDRMDEADKNENKDQIEPKKQEDVKLEPKEIEKLSPIISNQSSGVKGSKWIGKNRPKSNPV